MIFGFNTDIAAMDTVYHVQTEVREQSPRLESQIFVRGRCIGKRAGVVPEAATDGEIQELARAQHRWIVDALRAGLIEQVLSPNLPTEGSLGAPNKPNLPTAGSLGAPEPEKAEELSLELLGPQRQSGEKSILRLRVLSGGNIAPRAQVGINWKIDSASGALEDRLTNDGGIIELCLGQTDATVELEVVARLNGRETTRNFTIKPQP
jgi:hypothetical protein